MARRLVGVASLLAALAVIPSAQSAYGGHVLGPQRILVILVTWGPKPFAVDDVRRIVFENADRIYRDMSYGKTSLVGDVTPWLTAFSGPAGCVLPPVRAAGNAAAAAAGFNPVRYDRVVYVHPDAGCPWSGVTQAATSFLNGVVTARLVAHELGHSFGLGHANTTQCVRHTCGAVEYGDPYDTMGSGIGDFSARSKFELGWLTRVARAGRSGVYTLAPLERPASRAQAFVVTIAGDQYWIEYRSEPGRNADGDEVASPGILIRVSPGPDARGLGASALPNALLANPTGRHRPELRHGETFAIRGAFRLNVLQASGPFARLRFQWTDKVAPRAPRFSTALVGGRLEVLVEDVREHGSGLAHFQVAVDRKTPLHVASDVSDQPVIIGRPLPGTHTIKVVAVDRAGNRSPAAVRRVRIP